MKKTSQRKVPIDKEAIMKKHDFAYIREHFYDTDYTFEDIRGDIYQVYNDTLDLTQLSAEGKNTVRVTNFFVNETQSKATSVRAKMSPHRAIQDDDALCEIFNRIDSHPRFFNIRKDEEDKLLAQGFTPEILEQDISGLTPIQQEAIEHLRKQYKDALNKADLKEVRRAVAHMPSFHRVSQFPNHVAQRIYERYAPFKGAVILDSSSGWGNRLMATLSSKYGYKYLGTDPNSEMHPNYRALADTIYETVYKDKEAGQGRIYPNDYFDIRDQGSEFDIPEWHNNSGYEINTQDGVTTFKNKFTEEVTVLPEKLEVPYFKKVMTEEPKLPGEEPKVYTWEHPASSGKGINDTGSYATTGAKLKAIYETHSDEMFYSGIGDVSFTSPPYFFLECYTEDSQNGDLSTGQSAGKGANYMDWLKDFVYPTVTNHFNYLKPGAYYIYNLKDLPKEGFYIYSDWLSICLDIGFELIEQPEMILKSRRQFGRNDDGSDKINFKGATELVGVLRKPLKPTDPVLTPQHKDSLYHVINNFSYPLIAACRPAEFKSKLPKQIEDYLINKFKDTPRYKYGKRK